MRMHFNPPEDPAAYHPAHVVRVRFAETDAMGVVHHAAYLPYLEAARVEYLRDLGHPYAVLREEGFEFPVIEVAVRYLAPLRFDDLVDVHVAVGSARAASFQLDYLLTRNGQRCATAVTVHGVVDGHGRPTRVPGWLRALVRPPTP